MTILVGDVREQLRSLPAESVHCVVTSPPYWSLRSYSTDPQLWGGDGDCGHDWTVDRDVVPEHYTGKRKWQHSSNGTPVTRADEPEAWRRRGPAQTQGATSQRNGRANVEAQQQRGQPVGDTCRLCGAWRGELGGEPDPESYVAHIVEVFREVRRVLRRDGTVWCNLGDAYASHDPGGYRPGEFLNPGGAKPKKQGEHRNRAGTYRPNGLKPKDLVGIPWRVAFALQADGWYLRSDIIWSKPNPMPESVTDRPTRSHEYLFLLAKSAKYFYDADAVREAHIGLPIEHYGRLVAKDARPLPGEARSWSEIANGKGREHNPAGRNRRTVWEIPTQPTPEAHFATFPEKLVEPCILAGTSERGVCRDCGAPWIRVVEKQAYGAKGPAPVDISVVGMSRNRLGGQQFYEKEYQAPITTGWQPSCKHDAPVVPATCLDPFLGSGTTGRVAERLGRRWIGVELSESYAAIARRRTAQMSLTTWATEAAGD